MEEIALPAGFLIKLIISIVTILALYAVYIMLFPSQ